MNNAWSLYSACRICFSGVKLEDNSVQAKLDRFPGVVVIIVERMPLV